MVAGQRIEPGDVLALLNCGAYSLSQESQYNGRFRPAVVMIRANGEAELIRQREVFEDLIRNLFSTATELQPFVRTADRQTVRQVQHSIGRPIHQQAVDIPEMAI